MTEQSWFPDRVNSAIAHFPPSFLLSSPFFPPSSLFPPLATVYSQVHERHITTDFLLALLRRILEGSHPWGSNGTANLRVVLMSATIDTDTFSQ